MEHSPNEKSRSNNHNPNQKNVKPQNANDIHMNNIYGNRYTSNNIVLGDDNFKVNNHSPQNNINYPGYEVISPEKQTPPKKKKGFFARMFGMFSSGKKDDNKKEDKCDKKSKQPNSNQLNKNDYNNDQMIFNFEQNNNPVYQNNLSPDGELGKSEDDYNIPAENKYIPQIPSQKNTIFDKHSLNSQNKSVNNVSKETKNSDSLQNTSNIAQKNANPTVLDSNDTNKNKPNTDTVTPNNNLANRGQANMGPVDPPILRLRQADLNTFLEQYFNMNNWDNPNSDFNMNIGNQFSDNMNSNQQFSSGFGQQMDNNTNIDVDGMLKKNSELSEAGLTLVTINAIPTMKFEKAKQKTNELDKIECCICLQPFNDGEDLRLLYCFHRYHKHCVDEWLKKKSQCPNCNFNIRSIN